MVCRGRPQPNRVRRQLLCGGTFPRCGLVRRHRMSQLRGRWWWWKVVERPTPSSRVGAVQLPAFGQRIFDTRHLSPVVAETTRGQRSDERSDKVVLSGSEVGEQSTTSVLYAAYTLRKGLARDTDITCGIGPNDKISRLSGYARATVYNGNAKVRFLPQTSTHVALAACCEREDQA